MRIKFLASFTLALTSLLGLAGPASAQQSPQFPDSGDFRPLYCGRGYMTDGHQDQSGAIQERDIVGVVERPAGLRAVDASFLYLRLRLDDPPMLGNNLRPFAWGFEFSTDSNDTDYEVLISVDGASAEVRLYSNPVTTTPDSPEDVADLLVQTYPFATHARVVDAGSSIFDNSADAWLDIAVPWADLNPLLIRADQPLVIWAASSTNPDRLNGDFACHDANNSTSVPTLSGSASSPIAPDPARSPDPVGGPSGTGGAGGGGGGAGGAGGGAGGVGGADDDGNLIGEAGLEGGPGCDCALSGGTASGTGAGFALALGLALASLRRRRR